MTYFRDLHASYTLTRPFIIALRGIINTKNCECMFNKYVFNGRYKNGPFFYSEIVQDSAVIPKYFSPRAADFVTRLLEKTPSKRLKAGRIAEQNIKKHLFFNVSSIPISDIT
jgi:serine/threonine protein kinase